MLGELNQPADAGRGIFVPERQGLRDNLAERVFVGKFLIVRLVPIPLSVERQRFVEIRVVGYSGVPSIKRAQDVLKWHPTTTLCL